MKMDKNARNGMHNTTKTIQEFSNEPYQKESANSRFLDGRGTPTHLMASIMLPC
jgi:ribosomal protein L16/L10AE